ncbi:DUF4064 domain-containing protein [Halobacillus salinus]|uniref:DUF4064 domain-containing protein n=1 Tax=Halobacillus salinus TaxID=192814 RepID=A0A4Z0H0V2_9BACI|nr:DUF4064 domain-containing protein [Halobacillus salinus]TGB03494.1 DUF4064 domain-containing protein [Halobacillus salinus]
MSRTTEMVLGILGGLFGFGGAFFALFMGAVDESFNGTSEISGLGTSAFVFSILAIIGGILVKFKPKAGGWLMLVSGVAILISISLFGVVPALFLIAAGLMGIIRKEKKQTEAAA